ncbi:uncharacterized protein ACA1_213200 [Acanthamoeba castellanii str. Neff]|uniref:Uncharacterized protein n=1 Tax=Acanthamoeba castellanii (strain ATCC 30010 / Neff) TaxID=1257118 RepID=L8GQV6_ACACF|nr:uncharacterized protein ACA1_213200 [Acanthamoeba castellanii str. Neff]ELR15033.1 hypothetical protein ACA1_213200 [Acanthamoeba castellanii str. Neff]
MATFSSSIMPVSTSAGPLDLGFGFSSRATAFRICSSRPTRLSLTPASSCLRS